MKRSSSEIVNEEAENPSDKRNKTSDGAGTDNNGQTQLATIFSQQDDLLSGPQIESLEGFDKDGVKMILAKIALNVGCDDEEYLDPSARNVINKKFTNFSRRN